MDAIIAVVAIQKLLQPAAKATLTEWERGFIESIANILASGKCRVLTDRQACVVTRCYARVQLAGLTPNILAYAKKSAEAA